MAEDNPGSDPQRRACWAPMLRNPPPTWPTVSASACGVPGTTPQWVLNTACRAAADPGGRAGGGGAPRRSSKSGPALAQQAVGERRGCQMIGSSLRMRHWRVPPSAMPGGPQPSPHGAAPTSYATLAKLPAWDVAPSFLQEQATAECRRAPAGRLERCSHPSHTRARWFTPGACLPLCSHAAAMVPPTPVAPLPSAEGARQRTSASAPCPLLTCPTGSAPFSGSLPALPP
jgi:hypothetical protein